MRGLGFYRCRHFPACKRGYEYKSRGQVSNSHDLRKAVLRRQSVGVRAVQTGRNKEVFGQRTYIGTGPRYGAGYRGYVRRGFARCDEISDGTFKSERHIAKARDGIRNELRQSAEDARRGDVLAKSWHHNKYGSQNLPHLRHQNR